LIRTEEQAQVSRTREFLAAALLATWRIASQPTLTLWRDWVFILSVFWLITLLAGRSKAWVLTLGALMITLFALYLFQQGPHTVALFRSLR
jgi:hypothetical protein